MTAESAALDQAEGAVRYRPGPRPEGRQFQRRRALDAAAPRFAGFTAVAFLWNLSLMIAGPFFSVYLVQDLGASPTQIGLLAASFSATNVVGQRVWGRLNDRRGAAWWSQQIKTGDPKLDRVSILVRPSVTYALVALYIVVKVVMLAHATLGSLPISQAYSEDDLAFLSGITVFWFLGRPLEKRAT